MCIQSVCQFSMIQGQLCSIFHYFCVTTSCFFSSSTSPPSTPSSFALSLTSIDSDLISLTSFSTFLGADVFKFSTSTLLSFWGRKIIKFYELYNQKIIKIGSSPKYICAKHFLLFTFVSNCGVSFLVTTGSVDSSIVQHFFEAVFIDGFSILSFIASFGTFLFS